MSSDKAAVRMELRAARRALSPADRRAASRKAVQALAAYTPLREARVIALYAATTWEIDPAGLEAHLDERIVVYPRTTSLDGEPALTFAAARRANLVPRGRWSIPEPERRLPRLDPDFVVVPGLGFTPAGDRMGYGAGYYDRTLARLRAGRRITAVGLGFAVQLVASLPTGPHDQRLDAVFTEDGLVGVEQSR